MGKKSKFKQFITAFVASMGGITTGACINSTNNELQKLENSLGILSKELILFHFITGITAFVSYFFIRLRGPLLVLRCSSLLRCFIWILLAFLLQYQNPFRTMIYFFAILNGFSMGPIILYVSEIAEKEVRGAFASFESLNYKIGFLMSVLTLEFYGAKVLCYICIAICCVQTLFLFAIYEAPLFLVLNQQNEAAIEVIQWLRGKEFDAKLELENLENIARVINKDKCMMTFLKCCKSWRSWIIVLGVMFFYIFTGGALVHMVLIFVFKMVLKDIKKSISQLAVHALQILALIISICLIDKIGRRSILRISTIGLLIAAFSLGTCLITAFYGWLPLASFLLYIFIFSFGFGPILWVMIAELFPVDCKILACPLAIALYWFSRVLITYIFKFILGMKLFYSDPKFGYIFFIFGFFTFLALLFGHFVLPETKRKTFSEIEDILKGKKHDMI